MVGGRSVGMGSIAVLLLLVAVLMLSDREADDGGDPGSEGGGPVSVEVSRVVDGDTIEVDLDGTEEDVRYIGIDTPETVKPNSPVECFGPQASERNHELVEGERVRLVFDRERRDQYGRLLAYVYVGDDFINGDLVEGGYATTLEIEPNTSRAGDLAKLQQEASNADRGLWGAC